MSVRPAEGNYTTDLAGDTCVTGGLTESSRIFVNIFCSLTILFYLFVGFVGLFFLSFLLTKRTIFGDCNNRVCLNLCEHRHYVIRAQHFEIVEEKTR